MKNSFLSNPDICQFSLQYNGAFVGNTSNIWIFHTSEIYVALSTGSSGWGTKRSQNCRKAILGETSPYYISLCLSGTYVTLLYGHVLMSSFFIPLSDPMLPSARALLQIQRKHTFRMRTCENENGTLEDHFDWFHWSRSSYTVKFRILFVLIELQQDRAPYKVMWPVFMTRKCVSRKRRRTVKQFRNWTLHSSASFIGV